MSKEFAARMGITEQEAENAEYLGDGVYAWPDGYHIWIGTLEGHRIAFEPGLIERLNDFQKRMVEEELVPKK